MINSPETTHSESFGSLETSLGARFDEIATRYPDRIAVRDETTKLTYAALARQSREIAARIQARAGSSRNVVGVLMPPSAAHIIAVLAVVRAGRPYISLDPSYPAARLRAMILAAGNELVITTPALAAQVGTLGVEALGFDETSDRPDEIGTLTFPTVGPESFACIYFTSGSTGEPKPVVHTHRNILFDIRRQSRDMLVCAEDRFDLLFSPAFSAFLSPVFGALLTGASVHVFDLKTRPIEAFRDWLEAESITVSTMSVSTFRRLAATLVRRRNFPALRMISVGAEPLLLHDLEIFRTRFSETTVLQNALATTETRTIAQIYHRTGDAPPAEISVGRPVDGKILSLRDAQDHSVEDDGIGEIVIESIYISPGLWKDLRDLPEGRLPALQPRIHRTGDLARRLPDGRLIYHGRKDLQIKLRGHRIEIGEIESALLKLPSVANAAVFLSSDGGASREKLVALYIRRPAVDRNAADVRAALAKTLPDYMVPSIYVAVDALPLTDTGKLNRRGLEAFYRTLVPKPSLESLDQPERDDPLLEIWQRVLGVATIGPDDDFFASGGDSMSAVQLLCETERLTGVRLPTSVLLKAPTFQAFKAEIAFAGSPPERLARVLLQPGKDPAPLYILPPWNFSSVLFRDLARCEGGRRPVWGLESAVPTDVAATSIEAIGRLYVEALARFHPDGNFAIAGFSMGGFVAWETARQWAASGRPSPHVFLIDCPRLYAARTEADWSSINKDMSYAGRLTNLVRYGLQPGGLSRRALFHRAVGAKLHWWLRGQWKTPLPDPYAEQYQRNIMLSQQYEVRPYNGPVTLIRAADQEDWKNLFHWDLSWTPYCRGGLDIVEIPTTHFGLLQEPHVRQLSRALQAITVYTPMPFVKSEPA